MTAFPQIVVGTYEEFVLGYTPKWNEIEGNKCKLTQSFATHSHQASVRCVAAHGNIMASSGADEYINLYDMHAMEVSTVINYHNSTVTCLEFTPDSSHLVTANQNGDIAIFRCKDWTLVKLWKEAHKNANGVISTSIHPSGCLLITVGADNVLRFWNLIKGRQAYAINFSKKCTVGNSLSFALWSKTGNFYGVCIGNKVEIYKTNSAGLIYEINTKSKAICAAFTKKNLFCVGTEDGCIEIHSICKKRLIRKEGAHKFRVKCMSSFTVTVKKDDTEKIEHYLVTADSKGVIKLWFVKKKGMNFFLKLKGEVDSDCRITSLTVVAQKNVKQEQNNDEQLVSTIEKGQSSLMDDKDSDSSGEEIELDMKSKKSKQKIVQNKNTNKNPPKAINGKSLGKVQTPQKNNLELHKSTPKSLKNKKRSISETYCNDTQKEFLNSTGGSFKQFKKKKLSNSSRTSGKLSIKNNPS